MFRNAKQIPNQYTSVGSIFTISLLKIHDKTKGIGSVKENTRTNFVINTNRRPLFLYLEEKQKLQNAKQKRRFLYLTIDYIT